MTVMLLEVKSVQIVDVLTIVERRELMIELLLIAITWYLAKVYYTKTFTVQIPIKEEGPMVHAKCHKCSQTIYTHRDNLRAPYYCLACI